MPAFWTISYDGGAFEDADAVGVSVAKLEMSAATASKLTLAVDEAMDAIAPGWEEFKTLAVRRNGSPFFTGTIVREPREGSGQEEGQMVVAQGPVWWLEETMYLQERAHRPTGSSTDQTVLSARVLLNARRSGARLSTAQEIEAILQYAVDAGAPLEVGTIDLPSLTPVAQAATDVTLLEALRRQLAYHPDAVMFEDHSVSPPTINVVRASALAAVTQDANGGATDGRATTHFLIERVAARKPSAVAIFYERTHEVDDRSYRETLADIHPTTADPAAPRALVVTIPLQGSRTITQKQSVTTRTYPTTKAECEASAGRNWWSGKEPALELIKAALKFDDVTVNLTDANPPAPPLPLVAGAAPLRPPGLTPADVPRELVSGSLAEWMQVKAAGVTVSARMAAPATAIAALAADAKRRLESLLPERIIAGDGSVWFATTMSASFQATNATSKIYSRISGSTGAEAAPEGIAAQVYASLSAESFGGSITIDEDEPGGIAWMGKRLRFSGQRAEYLSSIMPVQSVAMDIASGSTTLGFGPPGHLGPQDLVGLLQSLRRREMVSNFEEDDAEERATPDTVIGGSEQPLANAVAGASPGAGMFVVTRAILDGSDGVSVTAGCVHAYGPTGVFTHAVAAQRFDPTDGVIYVTANTDEHQKVTSVSGLSKASSLPASTPPRRPNTDEPGDDGIVGTLHIEIARISSGVIEPKTHGAIWISEAPKRALWNIENHGGDGARFYDDSAGEDPPEDGVWKLRRLRPADATTGEIDLDVTEGAEAVEIQGRIFGGIDATFVFLDHINTPYSMVFTKGALTACTVNGAASPGGWTVSVQD